MKFRTMLFLFGEGIVNLYKNRLMSIAAIGTIAACIFVVGIFYTVGVNIEYMLDSVETNMGMSIFFEENTSQERILEIKRLLEVRHEVHRVEYISPEVAWEKFKEEYFAGHEEQLQGFENDNPLKESASLEVYFADLDYQKSLSGYIEALPNVRNIRQAEKVVEVMQSINQLVRYMSLALVSVLLLISIFLISNTVRLGISTRRKEIEIMKFIGAKDSFIKGPFIIEGAIIGLCGTAIPLGGIYYFYEGAIDKISSQFSLLSNFLVFIDISTVYQTLVPVSIAIGILIGILGSMMTIHKYLRV